MKRLNNLKQLVQRNIDKISDTEKDKFSLALVSSDPLEYLIDNIFREDGYIRKKLVELFENNETRIILKTRKELDGEEQIINLDNDLRRLSFILTMIKEEHVIHYERNSRNQLVAVIEFK